MRADRNSLQSEREDNYSRQFAPNVPFIMITINKNFAIIIRKVNIVFCHFHMVFDKSRANIHDNSPFHWFIEFVLKI